MDISTEVFLLLSLAAFCAGFIDAIAGGGGLIQLPSLLIALPDTPPAQLLGTNKLPSFLGTSGATISYLRRVRPDFKLVTAMAVPAFLGSALGAAVATLIPKDAFRPIILFALIGVFIYTWRQKELGLNAKPTRSRRYRTLIGATTGLIIGFYDGIFGPGTGSFLMLILVALLGFAFLEASVTAKLVNLSTNIGAIIVFGLSGKIIWSLGLGMAFGNILGGYIGAKTALRGGSRLVRSVFLFMTALLIARLAGDTFL